MGDVSSRGRRVGEIEGSRRSVPDVVPANLEALDFFLSQGYDLLNTIELRKSFGRTPPRAEISFLGRRFRLHSWPADKPLPGDKI